MPRCTECRGSGHLAQNSGLSYASAVVSRASDESQDLIMDKAEAEQAATQSSKPSELTEKGPSQAEGTKAADLTAKKHLTPAATPVGT